VILAKKTVLQGFIVAVIFQAHVLMVALTVSMAWAAMAPPQMAAEMAVVAEAVAINDLVML
jgi:hypothetical protein